MNLQDKIQAMERAPAPATKEIDASALFGEPEGTSVWTFRELSIPEFYSANDLVAAIRKQRPDWKEGVMRNIATVSLAHVSPEPKEGGHPAWMLYVELVTRLGSNFVPWFGFVKAFYAAFPALVNVNEAVSDAKNE